MTEVAEMPKRPDYGDATPEDLALASMRFQRPPLKKTPEPEENREKIPENEKTPNDEQ